MCFINWKYNIGDVIHNDICNYTIIDREIRIKEYNSNKNGKIKKCNRRWYKLKCNVCGYKEGWKEEYRVENQNCSCCSGRIAVKGINTIGDIRPDLIIFFKNEEDAYRYTCGSGKMVSLKCPVCKSEKKIVAHSLTNQGFSCDKCGDHISYPEKFIMSFLNQLEIDYVYQLSKTNYLWCDKYRYDFYLTKYNSIIEVHGFQHYENGFETCSGGLSLKQVQENDAAKKDLAIDNGIKWYFEINCSKSNKDFIYESILHSGICESICVNIQDVDFDRCDYDAYKNIMKEVCEYYNNNPNVSTAEISTIFKINRVTILKYLKKGTKLGLCSYDVKYARKLAGQKGSNHAYNNTCKPIDAYFKNGSEVGVFKNSKEAKQYIKEEYNLELTTAGICKVCTGACKTHKDFVFKYISKEEYAKRIQETTLIKNMN